MFLADAVAAYVESLSERELDAPLIALLGRLGFDKVHLVHGAYEFGKDFVAQRTEDGVRYQYCLQSKAGNLGAGDWRAVRQQVDAMRTGTVAHPDFDPVLERRLVVVTNGRLTGGAPIEAQNYNDYHRARGEAVAEFWDADVLVPHFEEVLVEGVPAQDRARTLELLGRLGQGMGTRYDIRAYAQPWFAAGLAPTERWRHVLTGAMLAQHAADQGREDLAAQIAFRLLRAAWERPEPIEPTETAVARRLFETHADAVWQQVKDEDPVAMTLRSRTGIDAFVLHPVKASRLCECLALLALLSLDGPRADRANDIGEYLTAFVAASPAAAHPVSDDAAFSVLATAMALAATGRKAAAESYLRDVAVWVLDLIEHGAGLADAAEPPAAAVRCLLGPAYPSLAPPGREPAAYALTVVLDLAHVLGFHDLYRDLVNDLEAVDAIAKIVSPDDGGGDRLVARIAFTADPGPVPAAHHAVPADATPAGRAREWFDCVAGWATYRDRHVPAVLRVLLEKAACSNDSRDRPQADRQRRSDRTCR
jgi:hypothetical protein